MVPECFTPAKQRRHNTGRLVGHCHQDDIGRPARKQGFLPCRTRLLFAPGPQQNGSRTVNQKLSQIVTEFGVGRHWADFELLVDLTFARSGWQRVSRVGATQAHTDLVLEQSTIGEAAFVQVKLKACSFMSDHQPAGLYRPLAKSPRHGPSANRDKPSYRAVGAGALSGTERDA